MTPSPWARNIESALLANWPAANRDLIPDYLGGLAQECYCPEDGRLPRNTSLKSPPARMASVHYKDRLLSHGQRWHRVVGQVPASERTAALVRALSTSR